MNSQQLIVKIDHLNRILQSYQVDKPLAGITLHFTHPNDSLHWMFNNEQTEVSEIIPLAQQQAEQILLAKTQTILNAINKGKQVILEYLKDNKEIDLTTEQSLQQLWPIPLILLSMLIPKNRIWWVEIVAFYSIIICL